jgi:hypothetical protein
MNESVFLPIFQAIDQCSQIKLRDKFYHLAVRYAFVRAQWNFMTVSERADMDAERTRLHNVLIDSINILARNMEKAGENIDWRKTLGDNRKDIGDLACYVNAWLGIRQR